MQAILTLELKGFHEIASTLALNMDRIGITAERVRAGVIETVEQQISSASQFSRPLSITRAGGDTWHLEFDNLEGGLRFGCVLLRRIAHSAVSQGLHYIKPSVSITLGRGTAHEGRIIDDASIAGYRSADRGYPFEFTILVPPAQLPSLPWVQAVERPAFKRSDGKEQPTAFVVDWTKAELPAGAVTDTHLSLPTLLLDSETIYSENAKDALSHLLAEQRRASEILAFGGPVSFENLAQNEYVRDTIRLMSETNDKRWTLVSYIPENEPADSYAWLELCRDLQQRFPKKIRCSAFLIPSGALRPFSFQVFDRTTVHVGLRRYSPVRGTPTMSGAILLRNREIAGRFYDEFTENYRAVSPLTDDHYESLLREIKGINAEIRKKVIATVGKLLPPATS